MDLDAAVEQVHNPVFADAVLGVERVSYLAVEVQRRVSNFDEQENVNWLGSSGGIKVRARPKQRDVWFGLTVGQVYGILDADDGSIADDASEQPIKSLDASGMHIPNGPLFEDLPSNQLDTVVFGDDRTGYHFVVVVYAKPMSNTGRLHRTFHWPYGWANSNTQIITRPAPCR